MNSSTAQATLPKTSQPARSRSVAARILRRAWSYTEMRVAASVFLALALLTVLGPFIIDASATKMNVTDKFLPPIFMEGGKLPHFLGTDQL